MLHENISLQLALNEVSSDDPSVASVKKIISLSRSRLKLSKAAFTTRRVDFGIAKNLIVQAEPVAGDLVLARVETLGHHAKLENSSGRRCKLFVGDEIVVAYGDRYAPDQFEAVVPRNLGQCHLVAGGGVAAKMISRHGRVGRATSIVPIGLLADKNKKPLNLRDFALPPAVRPSRIPVMIAVAGTSMNAGKTTAAAGLIHGLSRAGLRVGAAKVTGTGSGGDFWSMLDAGACSVLDFTDIGYSTTAGLRAAEVERTALELVNHLAAANVDIIVVEIADGLLQGETAALLKSNRFQSCLTGVLFAAADALGATAGVEWLDRYGLPILGVSGLISMSPLGAREAAASTGLTVFGLDELMDPIFAPKLCYGPVGEPVKAQRRIL